MQIHQREEHGVLVISLSGKILGDSETCQLNDVIKTALNKQKNYIVLDLNNVEWMGSVGFGSITSGLLLARQSGGDLRLTRINRKVGRLLTITKLDRVFQIYRTVNEGIKSFTANSEINPAKKTKQSLTEKTA
jgi:anti-sigma B factor antagonist